MTIERHAKLSKIKKEERLQQIGIQERLQQIGGGETTANWQSISISIMLWTI